MANFKISSDAFIPEHIPHFGNKFLTGNGYIGLRGTMEEFTKEHMPAVNMAGVYDKVGDGWRESVNAPNPLYTYITVDGSKLCLPDNAPAAHEQVLDIETAIHTRKTVWKTDKGEICITCERFASMANQHAVCMKYTLKSDFDFKAEFVTGIDISDGTLKCNPNLPSKWKKMSFKLIFKGELYSITIEGKKAEIKKI